MNVIRCSRNATLATGVALTGCFAFAGGVKAQSGVRPIVLPWPGAVTDPGPITHPGKGGAVRQTASAAVSYPARPRGASSAPSKGDAALPAPAGSAARVTGSSPMDGNFNVPLPDEKVLHLMVGHSTFIDTRHRLSRVYITSPDILNSYTSSPNEVVVTAKQPGTSNLILWDEVGDTQVYMIKAETNIDALKSAVKKSYPNDDITAEEVDGRLTLTGSVGTQAASDAVGKLAGLYGKDVANELAVNSSRIKQVRLKVRFDEVDRSKISQFGFNLFANSQRQRRERYAAYRHDRRVSIDHLEWGNKHQYKRFRIYGRRPERIHFNALNFTIYNAAHNIGATIQDLENKNVAHILAEPSITAMSGEKANFLAGGEFPFPVVQGGTAGSAAAVSIVFKPYGVKLDFTPVVNPDGTIDLTVAPEVSALDYSNSVTVGGYTVPALSTRRAQTRITLRNGQSFAISGLLDQRTTDALGRTPGIASIPILGALFRSKNINHSNSELLVIVTPELVDPLTQPRKSTSCPDLPFRC